MSIFPPAIATEGKSSRGAVAPLPLEGPAFDTALAAR